MRIFSRLSIVFDGKFIKNDNLCVLCYMGQEKHDPSLLGYASNYIIMLYI